MPSLAEIVDSLAPANPCSNEERLAWLEWIHGRENGADVYPHISVGEKTVIWCQRNGLTFYAGGATFLEAVDNGIAKSKQEGTWPLKSSV